MTVLFADLAGFTAMAEGRDPEAVKVLLDDCFGALLPVIEAHQGTVDKIIGDEVMAVFGAPIAHEDDPERAVRSGLALLEALEALDPSLEMRVGINTGEVLAGPVGPGGAYTVTGDTVNTAHRLVNLANPGEVLVARPTWAQTEAAIVYGERQVLNLRGRREPVVAHAARRVRRERAPLIDGPPRSPLVGRREEVAELTGAIVRSVTGSRPGLVVILGDAGSGKSRLLVEVPRAAHAAGLAVRVLAARCPAFGDSPGLAAMSMLVASALGVDPSAPPDQQRARLEESLDDLSHLLATDAGVVRERLGILLGLEAAPSRDALDPPRYSRLNEELASAARLVLQAAAASTPLVLLVDDAHWAADELLDQVAGVPSWPEGDRVTVVVTGREDLVERRPRLRAHDGDRHVVIALGPLPTPAARTLLGRVLAELAPAPAPIPEELEDQILEAAGGNPLLLEQLVRYLVESGSVVYGSAGWKATRSLEQAGLPDGVRGLLGARLDRLAPEERSFLQQAAVVGRAFDPATAVGLGAPADPAVIAALVERGLLVTEDSPDSLGFRHALVRDVAYASIPLGERAARHARTARWLESRAGPGEDIASIAHHYGRAVRLGRELGHVDDDLERVAARWLARAGREAMAIDALAEADRWYALAREVGFDDPVEAARVGLEHGAALAERRDFERARTVLEEVRGLVELDAADPGDVELGPLVATATARLAAVARLTGERDRAEILFDEARRRWQDLGDPAGEADALALHGRAEVLAGHPRAATDKLERALELAAASRAPTGAILQALGWAEFLAGEVEDARAHLWEAASLLYAADDRQAVGWCFGILGFSLWQEGRIAQASAIGESLRAGSVDQGRPFAEAMCTTLLAATTLEAGNVAGSRALTAEAERALADIDDPWAKATLRLVEGMTERVAGDLAAAESFLRRGLSAAARVGAMGEECRLRAELAATLLDQGRLAAAEVEARRTMGLVRAGSGDRDSEIRSLVVLAKRARLVGDESGACRFLEEAATLAPATIRTSVWRRAVALRAIEAADSGDVDGAHRLAADANTGAWESARTWILAQRAAAAALRAGGDSEGARTALEAALRRFDQVALAFLEPVRDDLRALEPRAPQQTGG